MRRRGQRWEAHRAIPRRGSRNSSAVEDSAAELAALVKAAERYEAPEADPDLACHFGLGQFVARPE